MSKFTAIPIVLAVYLVAYAVAGHRHHGHARGAGEYIHYRDFSSPLAVQLFRPAAYIESRLIQIAPDPFPAHPSWSKLPQRLLLRTPDNATSFSLRFNCPQAIRK